MRPPFNLAAVDAATVQAVAAGHRILQTHRWEADDSAHVALLLEYLAPPENGMVLDAGCGIGEVSRLMSAMRPDLSFVLMNVSLHQLSLCPTGDQYLHALDDCHENALRDASMDAVMFSSSLCQMDIPVALAEACRVLKPGGVLLVNDMVRTSGDPEEMERALAARVLTADALDAEIQSAGFRIERRHAARADDSHFRDMLRECDLEHVLDGVIPVIIRATTRKEAV